MLVCSILMSAFVETVMEGMDRLQSVSASKNAGIKVEEKTYAEVIGGKIFIFLVSLRNLNQQLHQLDARPFIKLPKK